MRAALLCTLGLLLCLPGLAEAQTQRCRGETYGNLAAQRYGDEGLGPLLAAFNGRPGAERCEADRFVRLPGKIRHEVQLGQTMKAIAARFCRGAGALGYLRDLNHLPEGTEPAAGQLLIVPAELELAVGARPEAELTALLGLPSLEIIRAYNGLAPADPFTPGGTIYVPLLLELSGAAAPPAATKPTPGPPNPDAPAAASTAEANLPASAVGPSAPVVAPSVRPTVAARPSAFPHAPHVARLGAGACATCHHPDPRRVGGYLPIDGELCQACHPAFEATLPEERIARLPLAYDHALHQGAAGPARAQGYELRCETCHPEVPDAGTRGRPGHQACGACHNPSEVKPVVATDCGGCHGATEQVEARRAQKQALHAHYRGGERGTDVFFGHAIHLAALSERGDSACFTCHRGVEQARAPVEIPTPRMADCLTCHRGLVQTLLGEDTDLDRCRTCHLSTQAAVAPVLSSVVDKPLSHTLAFRRRHGPVAAADDGVCAACHLELAGDRGVACQRCHQQIRPGDHSPRWREDPHGRAAVRDPDRCATCHLKERCADCHAEPPRDHFPRAAFQLRHARQARISTRRCLTCHTPEADCARCHDVNTR